MKAGEQIGKIIVTAERKLGMFGHLFELLFDPHVGRRGHACHEE
jgi:hypothetical protein